MNSTLPDRRMLPDRPARRAALEAEIGRRSRRILAPLAKWGVAAVALSAAATVGVITLVAQGDQPRPAAPTPTPLPRTTSPADPPPDRVLHLTTTLESDGEVIERIESWSVATAPRRERIIVDPTEPREPTVEYEAGGSYVTWRYDSVRNTLHRLRRDYGPAAIPGSAAYFRTITGIAVATPPGSEVTETTVDGTTARRVDPSPEPDPRGLDVQVVVDTADFQIAVVEVSRPDEQSGRRILTRAVMRAEYVPADAQALARLGVREQHPSARIVTGPARTDTSTGDAVRRDVATRPEASTPAEVARSMPRSSAVFVGTDPTCRALVRKVAYLCSLRRPPTPRFQRSYRGVQMGIVDRRLRISGNCVGQDREGITWRCSLADAARLGGTLLGRRSLGPASG